MNIVNKKIKKTDLSVSVILIIGIFIAVNFLSYQIFHRFDLTQNKVYSISQVSKKTVSELDDVVNIKAYFSKDLPNQLLSLKQEVADILDEYQAFSNGKIRVEFIDPGTDEKMQQELYMIGIPQLTFDVYEKDKIQQMRGYLGIAISYGDNVEAIPAIKRDTSDLEYQLTTAIKKVTSDEIATLGILISNGTADPQKEVGALYQELSGLYAIQSVDLNSVKDIPDNIDTLLIIGPKEEFSDEQLKAINNFAVRGGALLLAYNGVEIGEGLQASKNITGLESLMEKYGIKINNDLIADQRSGIASFNQGFITFSTQYPFWPKVIGDGFNQDNSAVSSLESVTFPWVSSVSLLGDDMQNNSSVLMKTTDKAWQLNDNFNISPNNISKSGNVGQYNLAVSVMGNMKNAYPGEGSDNFEGKVIVVGDSDFISDGFLRSSPDNLTFFQNLVDVLSLDDDLISIRSKIVSSRPIKEDLSDSSRAMIRYFNVFGLTIIVVAFGIIRYYMRRKSRFVDDL